MQADLAELKAAQARGSLLDTGGRAGMVGRAGHGGAGMLAVLSRARTIDVEVRAVLSEIRNDA